MNIFAHRGLLAEFPENSFSALTESVKRGFGLETDLRLTKDGDFVIIHDENFFRLTGVDRMVSKLTLAEAERLTYSNSEEKIISFRHLVKWLKDYSSNLKHAIHLKADSQTESGLKLIVQYWQEFDLYQDFFVFDLTPATAARLKALDSKVKVAYIVSDFKFEPTINLWEEVKENSNFDIVWAAEYRKLYSPDFINEVKKSGKECYAMSPDVHVPLGHPLAFEGYEETWKNLVAWGVDGICTDHPQKLSTLISKA